MMAAFLAAALLIAGYTVPAEPPGVQSVRARYGEVSELIQQEYDVYSTRITVNPDNVSYPAVGNYMEEITMYWTLDPGTMERVLHFVTVEGEHAAWTDYTEILYDDDGKVLFTFYTCPDLEGRTTETRRWFSGGEQIHSTSRTVSGGEHEYFPPPEIDSMRDPSALLKVFRLL